MIFVWLNIVVSAFFLVLAGFFSGVETGIYVLDPLRYHVRLKQGDREAKTLERLLHRKSQLVTSLLVGTNLSIFLATIYATKVTGYFYPGAGLATIALVTTGFTTAAVLIFAEMLPKNLYRKRADTLVYSSARAFYVFNRIFQPFVIVLSLLTGAVNFVFGRRGTLENEFLTRKAVEHHFTGESGQAALTQRQMVMVRNVMQLPVKDVLTAMIPLRDTVTLNEHAKGGDVIDLVREKRFSRMPVYRDSRSDIIGVLNIFDLFYKSGETGTAGESVENRNVSDFVRPIPPILRSTRIDEALVILREARQPMGLVIDPDKNTLGIVTVKDLLEEITGEIAAW